MAYLRLLLAEARASGASEEDLRPYSYVFEHRPPIVPARVPERAVTSLWNLLAHLTSDPLLGLRIAAVTALDEGAAALVRYTSCTAPTLRDAYRLLSRNIRLVSDAIVITLDEAGAALRRLHGAGRIPHPYSSQFALMSCLRWGSGASTARWAPRAVMLRQSAPARRHVELAEAMVGAPVRFGAQFDELLLERDTLDVPLAGADHALAHVLGGYAARLVSELPAPGLLGEARRTVVELLPADASITAVAEALGLSARTLQRRLRAVGHQHSTLVAESRRQLACQALTCTRAPVHAIAKRLGYADATAFARAFRRWFGVAPAAYRAASAPAVQRTVR